MGCVLHDACYTHALESLVSFENENEKENGEHHKAPSGAQGRILAGRLGVWGSLGHGQASALSQLELRLGAFVLAGRLGRESGSWVF
jgi:hypothetical protein